MALSFYICIGPNHNCCTAVCASLRASCVSFNRIYVASPLGEGYLLYLGSFLGGQGWRAKVFFYSVFSAGVLN